MGTRHSIPVFEGHDMTSDTNYTLKTTTNYGIALQLAWSGLSGESSFKIQGSLDGIEWMDYCLNNCGVAVVTQEIMGSDDTIGVMLDKWYYDWFRVVFTSNTATGGTIDGKLTIIDNQDVSV